MRKISKRITNNHSWPQSQYQMQATDIQEEEIVMNINLLYVEGTSKKLLHILISHILIYSYLDKLTNLKIL